MWLDTYRTVSLEAGEVDDSLSKKAPVCASALGSASRKPLSQASGFGSLPKNFLTVPYLRIAKGLILVGLPLVYTTFPSRSRYLRCGDGEVGNYRGTQPRRRREVMSS